MCEESVCGLTCMDRERNKDMGKKSGVLRVGR